jgi:outer membrane protein assembly factor BamB
MTFWQDTGSTVPRPVRRRPGRGRRWALVVAVVVVLVAAVAVVAMQHDDGAGAGVPPRSRRRVPHVVAPAWTRSLPDEPSVLVRDGRDGIVVSGSSTVSAFAARDGTRRWETRVGELRPSLAVGGDTVLVPTATAFVALARGTGEERWRTRTPESPAAVALVEVPGASAVALVATEEGGVAGLDVRTGRPRWSTRVAGRLRGEPAVDGGTGTVVGVWQGGDATRLSAFDGLTGAARFDHPVPPWAGSPAVVRHRGAPMVVVAAGSGRFDGVVRAFDLVDGERRWQARVPASFQPGLLPLATGGDVVVVDQLGTVTALDAGSGTRRWSTRLRAVVESGGPVRVRDALVVRTLAGDMLTLDRNTGVVRARRAPAGVPIGVVPAGRRVVLAQRLLRSHGLQAFSPEHLAAPARSPE